LDRIGCCFDECRDYVLDVLDPGKERRLAEKAVVDGYIEATAVAGEEPVEPSVHAAACSQARFESSQRALQMRFRGSCDI
jgi:hypothetical protein